MKRAAILLLLLSVSLASFGHSRVAIERIWTIESDGSPFEFTGAVAVNNSNQKVISLTTSEGMDSFTDENDTVRVHIKGKGESLVVLRAKAVVDIDYDTNVTTDPPLPFDGTEITPLTEYDTNISTQAVKLADPGSSLTTVASLVNWVHDNVEYDLSYWGKIKSAREVFAERRGVCVEYTHLLISLLRSLGFEARYVNGYVKAANWQPHAWAEVNIPGYGWLPADATFGQAGILDNTHLAIDYGLDQASAYDLLLTQDENAKISVSEKVNANFLSEDPKGVGVELGYDGSYAEVKLANNRTDYVLGTYTFFAPEPFGTGNSSVIVLPPSKTIYRYQQVNYSISEGTFGDVPVSASFNDASDSLVIGPLGTGGPSGAGCCAPAMLLFALALLAFRQAA
ncbi:MAG TPA: transglutaminase-like domain-containing protein [Candidatus Bilamarchaeum sp.]|nr:transglutaminase-like domain-containing protein [Candidatus Bilamarchaeum sp.]